jgi:hypothetical protein
MPLQSALLYSRSRAEHLGPVPNIWIKAIRTGFIIRYSEPFDHPLHLQT